MRAASRNSCPWASRRACRNRPCGICSGGTSPRAASTAWSTGQVPHYVTSNPFIARGYARVAASFAADCRQAGLVGPGETVEVIELGSGSGRFAHHFLIDFLTYIGPHRARRPLHRDRLRARHSWLPRRSSGVRTPARRRDAGAGPLRRSRRAAARLPGRAAAARGGARTADRDRQLRLGGLPQDCFVVADGGLQEKRLELSLPRTCRRRRRTSHLITHGRGG